MWNERIPVWEQRIPQWTTGMGLPTAQSRRARTPFTMNDTASVASMNSIVTRDWSLLLSPGAGNAIRRPWPEYEPESSAAVGRRWNGQNLGRLYEHVQPSQLPMSASTASMPTQSALY